MQFRILGPIEVVGDDDPIRVRGRPLSLLALLLIERGDVVSVDRAAHALWGDRPPADPRNALQVVVSRLRRAIGDAQVVHRAGGYSVALAPQSLDAARFEELLARGRREAKAGDFQLASETQSAALSLWRGEALANVRDAEFAQVEIVRLEELRLEAVEARIDAELALGAGADLVGELTALVAAHPLRERLRAAQMLALVRAGRQADALDAYQEAAMAFRSELGLDPGRELQALQRAILRQETTAATVPRSRRHGLRLPGTPFVGRDAEAAEATTLLLRSGRLLTLCGPGGTGKTRLAVHVAGGLEAAFADGILWIDLAPLRTGADVQGAAARAIAGDDAPVLDAPLDRIAERAAGRRVLVLLDNAEHVLEPARAIVEALLSVDGPRVLVTSREPLSVADETTYDVPPLSPADGIAMFTAYARRVDPTFAPDEHLSLLCARLDWLPLAIELAAARTSLFSPAQLLERVGESLDLLDAGAGADQRQRTLRGATDWSVALLDDDETQLYRRMSVFAADVPLETVELVCTTTADALAALVERRLVRRRVVGDGRPRFGMLETVRQHAAELLARDPAELRACRRRHAEAALASMRRLTDEGGSVLELEGLRPELGLALASAREESDPELELQLGAAMHQLWRLRGPYREGIAVLSAALERARESPWRGPALLALSDLTTLQGNATHGAAVARDALAVGRAGGERASQSRALNLIGNAAFAAGDLAAAADAYRAAIELERPYGPGGYLLAPLANLGHTLLELEELEEARSTLDECLVASAESDDRRRSSACLHSLGLLALHEGRLVEADDALRAGLAIAFELGVVKYQIDILGVLGAVCIELGENGEGVQLLSCADAQAAALGLTPDLEGTVASRARDRAVSKALDAVGPGAFEASWTAGRQLDLEAAIGQVARLAAAGS